MGSKRTPKITKKDLSRLVYLVVEGLAKFNPVVKVACTGSVYIKLTGTKVKEIRVANHNGRKISKNVWQLRTDAMTHRYKFNRIYNVKDINQMISDIHQLGV